VQATAPLDLVQWASGAGARDRIDPGVEVWLLDLDREGPVGAEFAALSSDERARAARKRSVLDARRYAAGRACLRAILGSYLAVPAAALRFRTEPLGRPVLQEPSDLSFSISRSEAVGLVAVSFGRAVGIDVESIAAAASIAEFADRYLPASQLRTIRAGPAALVAAEYVGLWTEVEACAKLDGRGLADLDPMAAAALLDWNLNLVRFQPTSGHVATLAYSGPPARLSYRAFEPPSEAGSSDRGAD
jgi:4'-phosphopantetheinyl transferase